MRRLMAAKRGPTKAEVEARKRVELAERIRASVAERRGKSMFDAAGASHGPMCRCGVPRKPPGISKHVNDDGRCTVHPDRPPMKYTRGAERYETREILQPPNPGGSVWMVLGQR